MTTETQARLSACESMFHTLAAEFRAAGRDESLPVQVRARFWLIAESLRAGGFAPLPVGDDAEEITTREQWDAAGEVIDDFLAS